MSKEITITTRKQLDIYMNPQRQRLLKCMDIKGEPMTPKQISNILEISPSSVTFHLKKLEELGLVELDHTEMIKGICAKYYKRVRARVNLNGGIQDDLKEEREVLADYMMNETWNGFKSYMHSLHLKEDSQPVTADTRISILYMTEEEARELKDIIMKFEEKYNKPKEGALPWEVAFLAYPKEGV